MLTWLYDRGAVSVRKITHRFPAHGIIHSLYRLGWVVKVSHGVYRAATPDDPHIPYTEAYQHILEQRTINHTRYAQKRGHTDIWDGLTHSIVCKTLREHDRDLADDPEALDRTFLSELVGIECDYDAIDIAEFAESATREQDKETERDKLADAILYPLSEEKETDTTRDPPRRVSAYYKAMDEGPEALEEYHRKHGRKTEGD